MKRDEIHNKNVAVRKTEKTQIKQLKKMLKDYASIFSELKILIPDSEVE